MTLTGGQTYFLFFCGTVIVVTFIQTLYAAYRIYHSACAPCKACRELKNKLDMTYRIAATALARTERSKGA